MTDRVFSLLFNPKDSPALINSGYAKIAQYITPLLMDAGWQVRLHTPVGHSNNVLWWKEPHSGKELELWSGGNGIYGEDIVPAHLQRLMQETGKQGFLLFLGDIGGLAHLPSMAAKREILAAAWAAVDWEAPSPQWLREKFAGWYKVIPFSHFGHEVLRQDGLQNIMPPVWFGVNLDVWKPKDRSEYPETMQSMGYEEDSFNVFSAFANQWLRKGEYEMFAGLAEFNRRHPEAKLRFFAFTQARRDWDLPTLVEHLGLQGVVRLSDDYTHLMGEYAEDDVVRMMTCSDAVVHLGYEGFGLQAIEAQALNKPVIGFNAAATPELLKTGILVPPDRDIMHTNMMRRPLPDMGKFVEALEYVWQHRGDKQRWGNGRAWVEGNLQWKHSGRALVERLEAMEQSVVDEEIMGPPSPGRLGLERMRQQVVV